MNAVVDSGAAVAPPTGEAPQTLSLGARAVAIFARPADAWAGLEKRSGWWFPMLISILVATAGSVTLHHRAMVPTAVEAMDKQIAAGNLTAERADQTEKFYSSPAGLFLFSVLPPVIILPVITFAMALVVWFGAGFVLGTRLTYRLGLEVVAWSGIVNIPAQLIAYLLAWMKQSFQGLHVGFGALLPISDTPPKLMVGLGVFLDALGPLQLWYLVVGILGAAALSGAPRKSVAWVLGGLYIAIVAFAAALAAMFAPSS